MGKFCANCGGALGESSKFCPNCGELIAQAESQKPRCAYCSAELKETSKFCLKCGKPVGSTEAATTPVNNVVPTVQSTTMSQMEQSAAQHGIYVAKPKGSETAKISIPQNSGQKPHQIYQQQSAQSNIEPKKKKNTKKLITSFVAALMAFVLLFTGLITPGWIKSIGKKTYTAVMTSDNPSATAGGITVDLGEWNKLENDTKLSVKADETTSDDEEGWQLEAYEISVGDMHQLDDFATIRIPYDSSYFDKGQDPSKCLGAKYYNEDEKDWQDILCTVDTKAEELVIYTDHFSKFGAFYVKNEGKRSAYITSISYGFEDLMYTDISELTKYLSNDKSSAQKALDFAIMLMDNEFDFRDTYAYGLDYFTRGEGSDYLSGAIKDTNTNWLTILGYAVIAYNITKMAGQTIVDGQADAELTLNTLHTAASTFVTEAMNSFTQVGSATLAVSMTGVFAASKMLSTMFQGADKFKTEDVDMIFNHYMEVYTNKTHKPITPMDWRRTVIDLTSKENFDSKEIGKEIEARIMKEAESFFELGSVELTDIVIEIPDITFNRVPKWTEAQKKKILDNYMNRMKTQVLPMVLNSVQEYHVRKASQAVIDQLTKTKKFYNTKITININGDKSYADHIVRFAPLNDTAKQNIKNWTGKLNSKGSCKTTATLIGFFLAGGPHELQVFKPKDNPDTASPVTTISFKIDTPTIDITLSSQTKPDDDSSEKYRGKYIGTVKEITYFQGDNSETTVDDVDSAMVSVTKDGMVKPWNFGHGQNLDKESIKWNASKSLGSATADGEKYTVSWRFEESGKSIKLFIDVYEKKPENVINMNSKYLYEAHYVLMPEDTEILTNLDGNYKGTLHKTIHKNNGGSEEINIDNYGCSVELSKKGVPVPNFSGYAFDSDTIKWNSAAASGSGTTLSPSGDKDTTVTWYFENSDGKIKLIIDQHQPILKKRTEAADCHYELVKTD